MKKVLITGASGLLGRALYAEFTESSWNVLGLAYSRAKKDLVKINLHDFQAVKNLVLEFKPDAIIHSAAERSPDKCEKEFESTLQLNVNCTKNLAKLAREVNAAFLYISTDYVFDGKNPPYKENDIPNPINKYGFSKWEGEKAVKEANPDGGILRVPVLYGDEEYIGESAVSSLFKALMKKDGEPVYLNNNEIRFPSCTNDIAKICVQLVDRKLKESDFFKANGSVFHWCGEEAFTKLKMAIILAEEYDLSSSCIKPLEETHAVACPRPLNPQLSCEVLRSLGIGKHTSFHQGIKCFKKFDDAFKSSS